MLALALASLSSGVTVCTAQTTRLEGQRLEQVVEELATLVEQRYVFPDKAHAIAEHLRERLFEGVYEVPDLETLALRLTSDLRSINDDRHLGVDTLPARPSEAPDPVELQRRRAEEERRANYGFVKLEILPDNIGYLELRGFAPTDVGGKTVAGDTAVAAMAFFANADALIIDLRANGGGEPSMIRLLCSYFFAQPTLLNTFEWRGQEKREESWTTAEVAGKRLADLPLFVLTSSATFSAAEEFAYDLKCLKRATLVGARTGGGAHPGDTHVFGGALSVFIPNGRAINPITGTNWEGSGVEPDLAVPAENALERALSAARALLAARRGTDTRR